MSVALYMDHHVAKAITDGLRVRGVDVLTAYEDGADRLSDSELLDRAGELGRVLFTQDYDFLVEGNRRQAAHKFSRGIIHAHQTQISVGKCIHDLELLAKACNPEDLFDRIEFLPL